MKCRCARYASPINFFKRKKKKKRKPTAQVEGFKKAGFLKKILPRPLMRIADISRKQSVFLKMYGWRFFLKPVGLELAFLNTWNLPLLPFFYFLFLNRLPFGDGGSWKGYQILGQKKMQINFIPMIFSEPKFDTLSCVWFCVCFEWP